MAIKKEGFTTIVSRGGSAIIENPFITLIAVGAFAILDASILQGILGFFEVKDISSIQTLDAMGKNKIMFKVFGGFTLLNLIKIILFGPLFAACAVYISRGYAYDKQTSITGAINFSLSRYKRLFKPYLAAQLSINLGMIILIPGILFLMQFAFVDAVACLEDEKHVLSRSKRLTRGRRRTLLWILLPWAIGSQVISLVAMGFATTFLSVVMVNCTIEMLYFFTLCSFFMLYEQRMSLLSQRRAEKQGKEPPKRVVLNRQNKNMVNGVLILGTFFSGLLLLLSGQFIKMQHATCVRKTARQQLDAIKDLKGGKVGPNDLRTACEKAKGQCVGPNSESPCVVLCDTSNITATDIYTALNQTIIDDDCNK